MNFYNWTDVQLASFSYTISHISSVGKIETDSTAFKCFLGSLPIWPYAHLCIWYCLCFTFALYCGFLAHTNSPFALSWKWTCWGCDRAFVLWNCRLEVPSTPKPFFGYNSILCLSKYKAEPFLIYFDSETEASLINQGASSLSSFFHVLNQVLFLCCDWKTVSECSCTSLYVFYVWMIVLCPFIWIVFYTLPQHLSGQLSVQFVSIFLFFSIFDCH